MIPRTMRNQLRFQTVSRHVRTARRVRISRLAQIQPLALFVLVLAVFTLAVQASLGKAEAPRPSSGGTFAQNQEPKRSPAAEPAKQPSKQPAKPSARDAEKSKQEGEPAQPQPAPKELAQKIGTLEIQNDALRKELDLSQGKEFYLLLDPVSRTLKLMLGGVMLQEYPLLQMKAGGYHTPISRAELPDLSGFLAADGTLDPPRELERFELVVDVESDEPPPEVPIPPPPEERFFVPDRYWIRFAGQVSIEIRSKDETAPRNFKSFIFEHFTQPIRWRIEDFRSEKKDSLRVMLRMSRENAASLYRVLPPATKLLILPAS